MFFTIVIRMRNTKMYYENFRKKDILHYALDLTKFLINNYVKYLHSMKDQFQYCFRL
jgi:hypothetical protein